jgi:16S rRNA processing protein RimM
MNEYRNIGKLVAAYGFKGDIVLQHHFGKKTGLAGLESLFMLHKEDSMFPYFIQHIKIKSDNQVYIKLEGIDSKEDAEKLLRKEVWITEKDFLKYAHTSAPASLVNFHLINEGVDLGEITEVIELPHQLLCKIHINNKEALIPLHEETLKKIDKKNRQVHVSLPDGLLDIYQ